MKENIIKNRMAKNWKQLKKMASKNSYEALRLYDRDIPEFPYIVEKYNDHFVVWEKGKEGYEYRERNKLVKEALADIFSADDAHICFKKRLRQRGTNQYDRLEHTNEYFSIQEGPFQFRINIQDFLDTGLYLNHRPLREEIHKLSSGKKFLNLFSYTSSMSVAAALGGAITTSIDLSNTYLKWGKENFKLNQLDPEKHYFVKENVLLHLEKCQNLGKSFDLIYCDPPTFSNSKKMSENFEIQEDHEKLIERCMSVLSAKGSLYFSGHKKNFKLSYEITSKFEVSDMSIKSVPLDFRNKKIHYLYKIEHKLKKEK
ncbi:MAG: class I SAM-dependent methyltransferase [Bdellovibrionota bacterium]|nr:class I SAM-dependent methyltransferase [Bdellovibrionota bacterium]